MITVIEWLVERVSFTFRSVYLITPISVFRQTYEAALNKISDQATKERLLYGNWDFVEANDMAIYGKFDGSKHLITGLKERVYDPTKPLITVWDFNVAPQMSVLLAQVDYENKKLYVIEEILGKPQDKENNTPALARRMQQKLYREKHNWRCRCYRRPVRITTILQLRKMV